VKQQVRPTVACPLRSFEGYARVVGWCEEFSMAGNVQLRHPCAPRDGEVRFSTPGRGPTHSRDTDGVG